MRLAHAHQVQSERTALGKSADVIRDVMSRWERLDEDRPAHRWRARREIALTIESLIAVLDRLTPDCDLEDEPQEADGDEGDNAWPELSASPSDERVQAVSLESTRCRSTVP